MQKVRTRGCIDLTDSGLRVKTRKGSPHEETVNEARSHQSEIYRRVQTGGAGVMAGQRRSAAKVAADTAATTPGEK